MSETGKRAGGVARAKALTPERRAEIATAAAQARWNTPKATHLGELALGDVRITCAVLEDGRRVISGRGITSAIGMKGRGQGIARIASHKMLEGLQNNNLLVAIQNPIKYLGGSPKVSEPSDGFEAIVLQELCEAILQARDAGMLKTEQEKRYGQYADMLIRSFARVGIVALVDEATGYQEVRDKMALHALLDKFLKKEFAAWAKRFPNEFYQEMFRLKGWSYNPMSAARPGVVGTYTTDIVYERLAPGIVKELETINPKNGKGNRKAKHHQWLTDDVGHPALAQHLHAVIGFMRACSSWDQFMLLLDRAFPRRNDTLQIPFS